tara:strand:- start:1733 stop:2701 length:969 start_codon:yes stop_codon:yes gene_type:complete
MLNLDSQKIMNIILKTFSYQFVISIFFCGIITAQNNDTIIGKWDLNVTMGSRILPSWLEVKLSGSKTLIGYFVEYNGSARPISEVHYHNGIIDFSIPPQWNGESDLHFSAKVKEGKLVGTILGSDSKVYSFEGERAPQLIRTNPVAFGKPILIFNGTDLKGWQPENPNRRNQWLVKNGILVNPKSGINLVTTDSYGDFKLHIEVRIPQGSNSGIYLRGRYEVQVEDSYGKEPSNILFGAVYGFLTPNEMVANPAGEWQVFDITLIGRRVTVIANGKTIINDQIIPGITGGALDSNEANAGPLMLQGDHGKVEYRNITIRKGE